MSDKSDPKIRNGSDLFCRDPWTSLIWSPKRIESNFETRVHSIQNNFISYIFLTYQTTVSYTMGPAKALERKRKSILPNPIATFYNSDGQQQFLTDFM